MANPYALDFNPLASAITDNQQMDLARNRLAMDQERLGFEREFQPLKIQGAQLANQQAERGIRNSDLEFKNAVFKTFSGAAQNMAERLAKNPNDAAALADYNAMINHKDYRDRFAAEGVSANDPQRGLQQIIMHARPYQDPQARELQQSEIDKNKAAAALHNAQAAQGKFINLSDKSNGVFDTTTRQVIPIDRGDTAQRVFNENYAREHAPKNYDTAASEYATAAESAENIRSLQTLAPYAKTGYSGPIPPEAMLTARKMAASVGLANPESIAPTELFKFLAQKGVFNLTSQLKPASNLDMIASERATASMQTDPTTLPLALPVLLRVEERKMAYREAMMDFYRRGVAPSKEDFVNVVQTLNKRLPLLNMDGVPGQVDGPAGGPRVNKPATGRLGDTQQSPPDQPPQATGWTPEDLATARPGQKTPNGKYIFGRDGKLHPVAGDAGSERNPHEVGLFSGPTLKDGEFATWNGKLYQQRGSGFGSLVPVERQ